MKTNLPLAALLGLLCCAATALADDKPAVGAIPGIGPAGEIVRLHTGFKFTEGPAADAEGNVYFTDIPNNRIHMSNLQGKLRTFLEESQACNGLMFDALGRLVACQGKAHRLIAIDVTTKQVRVVADQLDGKPLGVVPNDLAIDRDGGIYFTDPEARSVFYVDATGKVARLLQGLPRPNGVLLAPDEKTLYVLPSGSADVMAYPVELPGKLGAGRVLCQLVPNPKNPGRPGGDGLTLDEQGNLYLTRPSMKLIQVVDPKGRTLGLIHLPEEPANCTFGGKELKTLYVTAQTSLYAIPMQATGHRFASAPLP
jgi:gluconolactonase